MASSKIPENQKIFLDAYEANIFDFNTVNSKVYLTRKINTMMNVFGDNCVIEGLGIASLQMNVSDDITVIISPGKMITDLTLIEYMSPITLTLNVDDLDDAGYLVVMVGYSYLDTSYTNLSKISLRYINSENYSRDFINNHDRQILAKILFDKTTNIVSVANEEFVTINNILFQIRKPDKISQNIESYLEELF